MEEEKGEEAEAVFTGMETRVEQEDALNTPHTRNIDPDHGWTRASACEGGGCLAREENHSGAHAQHPRTMRKGAGGDGGEGGGVCVE